MLAVDRDLVEATLDRPVLRGPEGEPRGEVRVRDVIGRLQDAGIRIWMTGGTPRDWLYGQVSNDVDLSLDRDLASAHALLREAFPGEDPVAFQLERFGMLRWGDPELGELDLNILRSHEDIQNGNMWTTAFVPRSDLEADCRMRDFSVNAFYYDCQSGELLDPLGVGLDDLRTRTLRLIAHPSVLAGSYRMSFRILQFLARGYHPAPETLDYLDQRLDRDVQGMGPRLYFWIKQHVIARGGDLSQFRASLEERVREPASREVLGLVFAELSPGVGREA
ncbi:MAG TPA: CCA tRNA nucleotidyltransferase [Thermoanaerobaculia bacterium]|nr:CCA tRNA nucleotidyltransferase [Thermoanaerobaculia bacterium]